MELYNADSTIATAYDYTPYGTVTATGLEQPIQWSSEYYDSELALVYYNYRYYNPLDGRWINRDPIMEQGGANLYGFVRNNCIWRNDWLGLADYIFESETSIKKEAYDTYLRASMLDNAIRGAKKFTKGTASHAIRIYAFLKELPKVLNTGGIVNGDQFRVFIKSSCTCRDGFFWCGRSTMDIKTRSFTITPKDIPSYDGDYSWGFVKYPSNPAAVAKEINHVVDTKVYNIKKEQEERCKVFCANK